jgi:hypothetical protein
MSATSSHLWIDDPAAPRIAQSKAFDPAVRREDLLFFIENGYVILEGAVAHDAIDRYLAELEEVKRTDPDIRIAFGAGEIGYLRDRPAASPNTRIVDSFMFLASAVSMIFSKRLEAFLSAVFDDRPMAFQGLHFEVGSEQAVHQDPAYVVVDMPGHFVAAWIALEDIQSGSGELAYYPKSHRFPFWEYKDGARHWNPERDGFETHKQHLQSLHTTAQERGIDIAHFLPKKGDVLLWHADLAHGGSARTRPELSRRSLVVHYCPEYSTPHFYSFVNPSNRYALRCEHGSICSYYYDLEQAQSKLGKMGVEARRTLGKFEFDPEYYLATYADAREALAGGTCASAREHYESVGRALGRLPFDPARRVQ